LGLCSCSLDVLRPLRRPRCRIGRLAVASGRAGARATTGRRGLWRGWPLRRPGRMAGSEACDTHHGCHLQQKSGAATRASQTCLVLHRPQFSVVHWGARTAEAGLVQQRRPSECTCLHRTQLWQSRAVGCVNFHLRFLPSAPGW
jgi:hypothetical protein